ncbi:MAG: hypothetical protein BWZ07_02176 [Alphaproteobacteria bacterium ADurb.BinA280]|nr:MAG: hypothetical protein BWZ07_02176 [Alphaproteobacteria bacterium ADurb.BinA280]
MIQRGQICTKLAMRRTGQVLDDDDPTSRRLRFALIQRIGRAHREALSAQDASISQRQNVASNLCCGGVGLAHRLCRRLAFRFAEGPVAIRSRRTKP